MDYITKKIKEKSELNAFTGNYRDAATQEQSRLEYILIIILGYLWNKNINRLDEDEKSSCHQRIIRPSIGSIIAISRKLDIDGEVFGNRKLKVFRDSINNYPAIRNEKIGHGFSFDDDAEELYNKFSALYSGIYKDGPVFLKNNIEIIHILSSNDVVSKGILYKPNGEYSPCSISNETEKLNLDNIYIRVNGNYYQISPFVKIKDIDDFYIFSYIEDRLASRAVFNQLIKTKREYFKVDELIYDSYDIDENRLKSTNGTIINNFNNNYKKYINTSIVNKLVKFLKENKSTVFSTVWGHGGVGKTASIQRVCEVLLSEDRMVFDYIIFVSAKDRKFNYHKGAIETVSGSVDSYDSAIRFINNIVFNTDSSDPKEIIEFQGKILIILDDYETFNPKEKEKLLTFIKSLNILHHKVVITTRSANSITGEEIEVEELTAKESLQFFDSVLENELSIDSNLYKQGKDTKVLSQSIHQLTSGRPLFIFQSAIIYGESGSITSMLESNINKGVSAIEFLYGRIIEYLSPNAKKLFGSMGLLTTDRDLSNLLSKLQYILNMEKDEINFEKSIEELTKLKIITIIDNKYFHVYSSEIVSLMKESFQDDGSITSRLQAVGRDKDLDNDLSLLDDADNSRLTKKSSEVEVKYRSLISRKVTPFEIRVQAVTNLAQYLIEDNGRYDEGIGILENYQYEYNTSPQFVKTYATYLWRGDQNEKKKAIDLINNLLRIDIFNIADEKLDFLCILMRYEATYLIDAREDLKDAYRLQEITKSEYNTVFGDQRQEFYRIHTFPGLDIIESINNDTLKDLSHDMKVKVLNGLSYYIEVCLRRKKHDEIDEVLTYVFNHLKQNYHDLFKRKIERINRSRNNHVKKYDDYILEGSIGDRYKTAKVSFKPELKVGSLGEILAAAISNTEKV